MATTKQKTQKRSWIITEEEARREFAHHVATRSQGETHLKTVDVLEWAVPGSWNFRVVYMVRGRTLFVNGDLGDAVHVWPQPITLEFVSRCGLQYYAEKCGASEYGRSAKEWSEDAATARLQEIIDERIEAAANDLPEGKGALIKLSKTSAQQFVEHYTYEEALGSEFEWNRLLCGNDSHEMMIPGTEDLASACGYESRKGSAGIYVSFEERYDIGMVYGRRIQFHLWGLKLAMEQLEKGGK